MNVQRIVFHMTPYLRQREECILAEILRDTCLPEREPAIVANDTNEYNYDNVHVDVWRTAVPFIERNIIRLQSAGQIRYGAWTPLPRAATREKP